MDQNMIETTIARETGRHTAIKNVKSEQDDFINLLELKYKDVC